MLSVADVLRSLCIRKFISRSVLGEGLRVHQRSAVSSQSSVPNLLVHMELLQGMNSSNQSRTRIYVRTLHCANIKKC